MTKGAASDRRAYTPRAAALCSAALCAAGCDLFSSEPAATNEPPLSAGHNSAPAEPESVGGTARAAGYELSVQRTTPCPRPGDEAPTSADQFLGVELSLKAIGPARVPVNAFYARLEDSAETSYRAERSGCTPVFEGEPLRQGERARGFVTFKLPSAASGLRFIYEPRVGATGERQAVSFDLGR